MPRIPLRLILAAVAAALSLTLLTWSLFPPGRLARQQSIQPGRSGLPGARLLDLDFPAAIRFGEADRVHLSIKVDGPAPVAGVPNLYETDDVLAEARLDMAGMEIRPLDTVSEPLFPGQSVTFFWSLRPSEPGRLKGTVWFYLRFVPKNGGLERRQAISAQNIEIESTALFGLQAETARWLGLAGVFVSSLLGFSFFVDALKGLWKKTRRVV